MESGEPQQHALGFESRPDSLPAAQRGSKLGRWMARPNVRGLLFLAVLTLFFLREPILRFGSTYYSSADLSQGWTLTRALPTEIPSNVIVSDPAVQMQPWLMFVRSELSQGRWPLWNPFNGLGAPLFANYQSGVLSLFNLPFLLLGMRVALLLSCFLKLFALGGFTFLYLRSLKLGVLPAVLGGMAFEYSGHNIVLLGYPHAGAMATLPAGILCLELAAARMTATGNVRTCMPALLGLFASLGLGALAGHPEAFYFSAVGIALYALVRIAVLAFAGGGRPHWTRKVLGWTSCVALAALLAAGVGAIQFLPFFEYLELSSMLRVRAGEQTPLYRVNWPLHLFPDIYGAAPDHRRPSPFLPLPNYEASITDYAGATALLLALVGAAGWRRQWFTRAFVFGAVGWILYGYNLFDFGHLLGRIPGVGIAPINRSQGLYLFAVACLVGIGADRLLNRDTVKGRAGVWIALLLGGLGLAAAHSGAVSRIVGMDLERTTSPEFFATVMWHVIWITASAVASLVCVWLMLFVQRKARVLLAIVLGALLWFQTGHLLENYNPTIPDRFFFPRTFHTTGIRNAVGDEPVVIVGADTIPPCTNIAYDLTMLPNYDALGIYEVDRLLVSKFQAQGNWQITLGYHSDGMSLLGVRHVVVTKPIPHLSEVSRREDWGLEQEYRTGPIEPGRSVKQQILSVAPGLRSVSAWIEREGLHQSEARVRLTLRDSATNTLVATRQWRLEEMLLNNRGDNRATLRFDPIPDSKGRQYTLVIEGEGTNSERHFKALGSRAAAKLWRQRLQAASAMGGNFLGSSATSPPMASYTVHDGDQRLPGSLLIDCGYGADNFELVDTLADHLVYRWNAGLGRAFFIDQVLTVGLEGQAWEWVREDQFDPRKMLVISEPGLPTRTPSGSAHVREASYERLHASAVQVRCENAESGYVYIAQPFYPGWKATLDGQPAPILRANTAFMAVPVGPGKHTLRLEYQPESFRKGAWTSAAALLMALVLAALGWRRVV